jgi:branched-chain amino acid transport system substrate-binding protein
VFDLGNSAISLAAQQIMRERNRIIVHSTSATSDLTGSACSPVGFHWVYDTYSNSSGIAKALMSQGLDTWFFVTVDYAFGKSMEAVARTAIEKAGGKVVGAVRHPLNTSDFSSYLLQVQSSNAKVIVFANAGVDLTNCIKQAAEFRLSKVAGGSQTVVAPVMSTTCFWSRSNLRNSRNIRGITTISRPCFPVLKRSGRSMRVVAPWFAPDGSLHEMMASKKWIVR